MKDDIKLPPLPGRWGPKLREFAQHWGSAAIKADRQMRGEPVGYIDKHEMESLTRNGVSVTVYPSENIETIPVYTAPQPAEPDTSETLWCLHIQGPDDVYAAPSKAYAEVAADLHNARFDKETERTGVMCKAAVAPWPYSPDLHAQDVGGFVEAWLMPQPAETRNDGFDKWLENPYTKALEKSIKEDYVPQPTVPAQEPSVPGYTVMDRGFLYENGKTIPTLLLAFPIDDWDSRDLMADMLAAAPEPPCDT